MLVLVDRVDTTYYLAICSNRIFIAGTVKRNYHMFVDVRDSEQPWIITKFGSYLKWQPIASVT